VGKLLGAALGLALLIVVVSALFVLLRSVAPKFTASCRAALTSRPGRSFAIGLILVLGLLTLASQVDAHKALGPVLVLAALALLTLKMYGGAAFCGWLGDKAAVLAGNKKPENGVRSIAAGVALVVLASATIIPGLLVLLIVSLIELGAATSALLKLG
jgi:hypothetical protein